MPDPAAAYLVVETRSDLDSPDVAALLSLVRALHAAGHDVRVFLIQDAVLMAGQLTLVDTLARAGVPVSMDEYSGLARGIDPHRLPAGVEVAGVAELVRHVMTPGVVTVWH